MTEREAQILRERIQMELPEGYHTFVQHQLFSTDYTVSVHREVLGKKGLQRVMSLPREIRSYRQWRANRRKLTLS